MRCCCKCNQVRFSITSWGSCIRSSYKYQVKTKIGHSWFFTDSYNSIHETMAKAIAHCHNRASELGVKEFTIKFNARGEREIFTV